VAAPQPAGLHPASRRPEFAAAEAPAAIRVVVAEPASSFRSRISGILARESIFDVAAVSTSEGIIRACTSHPPDVALVAMNLPSAGAIATTARLREIAPSVRIVVWLDTPDGDAAVAALRAGARGILDREVPPAALVRCVKHVAAGEASLPRHLVAHVIAALQTDHGRSVAQFYVSVLTRREREVLALVGEGCANRDIARRLAISEFTAKRHVHNLLEKLAVPSRAAAAGIYGSARLPVEDTSKPARDGRSSSQPPHRG
jgi:DNA-binding NarL/FixJ family response regulator